MSGRKKVVLAIVALSVVAGAYLAPKLVRLYRVVHLYDEDRIAGNFIAMNDLFPVSVVHAGAETSPLRTGSMRLPESFEHAGKTWRTMEYLDYSRSTGMVVLRGDEVLYERYWLGHRREGRHISWSVAKSFVSALVGIALEEGLFDSIDDPITSYLPELAGTGYDAVPIRDVLEMSSGVGFNEDYGDYDSDINRFGRTIAFGGSMADFAASLERSREPGTYHHYVSIDTQVLAMLVKRVSGESITDYLESRIWKPLGMERDAYWMVDATGMEVALGGLNASLRDYARMGLLYLDHGSWRGRQVVPKSWVRDSTTAGGPHLLPGKDNPASSSSWGYGYQWWIPDPAMGDFTAAGIYNQYIYVNPAAGVVIAKNSANHRYTAERQESKDLHIAMFRAIADEVAGLPE